MSNNSAIKTNRIYSKNIIAKRNSRVLAVQTFYSYMMYRQAKSIETVLHEAISNVSADITVDQKYVANIVMGIDSTKTILEEKLQKYLSEEWKFSRLGKVVQALLLSACYEIIFTKDLPAPIIINEYLEIAKLLNHEGEVGFINNVLDSIVKETAA